MSSPAPVAAPAPEKPSFAVTPAPAFDVVRVETSGDTVVAGHAAAGANVELRDGDRVLSSVVADPSGQFVIVPEPLKAGAHQLRLAARVGDGEVLVSEPSPVDLAPRAPAPAIVALAPSPEAKAAPAPLASSAASAPPSPKPPVPSPNAAPAVAPALNPQPPAVAIAPSPEAKAGPAAPAADSSPSPKPPVPSPTASVVIATAPPVKPTPLAPIVTPTPGPSSAVAALAPVGKPNTTLAAAPGATGASRLVVRRVKATEPGRLEADGEADAGSKLRLTLNGSFLADVAADADGLWSLTIEHGMTAGLYALEAEELGSAGHPRAQASFAYPQNPAPSGAPLASAARVETAPVEAPKPTHAPPTGPATADVIAAAPLGSEAKPPPAPAPSAKVAAAPIEAKPAGTPAPTFSNPSHAVVAQVRTTTVAPGDNLWDLAIKFYNDGTRYSDIYAANAGQIRNPSLIYIGQVFVLPQDKPRR